MKTEEQIRKVKNRPLLGGGPFLYQSPTKSGDK